MNEILKEPSCQLLTSADSFQSGGTGAKVAFQPLGVITRLRLATVLIELFRADFTAFTTIQNQTHSWSAFGNLQRTFTSVWAGRRNHLQRRNKGTIAMRYNPCYCKQDTVVKAISFPAINKQNIQEVHSVIAIPHFLHLEVC